MKVLVFGHRLEVGGTQVNSIELAAALRDRHGHEVVYVSAPGPMVKLVEEKGLRFIPVPDAYKHPSLPRVRALYSLAQHEKPDLIHAWDWWQCLDAYYGAHLLLRIPLVVSVMTMDLHRLLPLTTPITLGTGCLLDEARATGRHRAELVVPPVDVHLNAPNAVDAHRFRERYGIQDSDITLVTVSRVVGSMKSESLLRTVEAVRVLGREFPLRFIIVGDGDARGQLENAALQANAELKRKAVVLTGAMIDPREAYAAADVVVGMGGSALRAMAFAKPVIIVGERGFSAPFTPATAEWFYYHGIYGLGNGETVSTRLVEDIRGLLQQQSHFAALGQFSREFVVTHFSLEEVSGRLESFYRNAISHVPGLPVRAADGLRTGALATYGRLVPHSARRRVRDLRELCNWNKAQTAGPSGMQGLDGSPFRGIEAI